MLARSNRPRLTAGGLLRAAIVVGLALWCAFALPLLLQVGKGGDAVSLAIAGRLVAGGETTALYAQDEARLAVGDSAWTVEADELGYAGRIYPYLYPPLIAWLAAPLDMLGLMQAKLVLLGLTCASLAFALLIAVRSWAPDLLRSGGTLGLAVAVLLSWPLATHVMSINLQPVVILAIVIAVAAAQGGRSALAGVALAVAAAIKLTPAILILYWIATRRFACVAWFLGASAALLALGVAVAGVDLHLEWLQRMQELAGAIIPTKQNRSLAGLFYGIAYGLEGTEAGLPLHPLPGWIKAASAVLAVAGAAWCLLDSSKARRRPAADAAGQIALILVAMMAAPLAWDHYFLILAVAGVIWFRLSGANLPPRALMILMAVSVSQPVAVAAAVAAPESWQPWVTGFESFAALALIALLLTARRRYFLAD
ncbi:MAG TPA: glycosyltransferase family 87 protein [Alphaproteobacteria bacterium]